MRLSALTFSGAGCGLLAGVYVQVQNQGVASSRARRSRSSAAGLVWLLPRLTQRTVSRAAVAMLVRPATNGALSFTGRLYSCLHGSRLRALPAAGGAGLELRSGASSSGPTVSADCGLVSTRSLERSASGDCCLRACATVEPVRRV
jgi:hypothetical protein